MQNNVIIGDAIRKQTYITLLWYLYVMKNCEYRLTLKHQETHGCVISTVATDTLVLKHQAISILSTD